MYKEVVLLRLSFWEMPRKRRDRRIRSRKRKSNFRLIIGKRPRGIFQLERELIREVPNLEGVTFSGKGSTKIIGERSSRFSRFLGEKLYGGY